MPLTRFDRADGVGLRCLVCDSVRNDVIESRRHAGKVFRVRRCRCGERFTTIEQPIDNTMWRAISGREAYHVIPEGDT